MQDGTPVHHWSLCILYTPRRDLAHYSPTCIFLSSGEIQWTHKKHKNTDRTCKSKHGRFPELRIKPWTLDLWGNHITYCTIMPLISAIASCNYIQIAHKYVKITTALDAYCLDVLISTVVHGLGSRQSLPQKCPHNTFHPAHTRLVTQPICSLNYSTRKYIPFFPAELLCLEKAKNHVLHAGPKKKRLKQWEPLLLTIKLLKAD